MSNNFEIAISMLKKSLIVLLFIFAIIPLKAESLQELINRRKIEAIAKVKPIVQKMINDSIEIFKKHPLWNDDYKDAENFHYIYKVNLDYNDKAFYFDDTTSVNSIIDTTKLLSEEVTVIDKQYYKIADISINNREEIDARYFLFEYPINEQKLDDSYLYNQEQIAQKQFGEEVTFVTLSFCHISSNILFNNRIYINRDQKSAFTDLNPYQLSRKFNLDGIRYEGISKKVEAISRAKNFKPEIKRDFSKSISRIEKTLESLDNIYLKPIINDKNNNFFRKILKDEYSTISLYHILTDLGLTFDEFIRDSAKLNFKSKYWFYTQKSLVEFQAGDNILDSLNYNPRENSEIDYNVYWDDMRIGFVNGRILHYYTVCDESECDNTFHKNKNDYSWLLETEFGSVIKIKNELYFQFSYYNNCSPIPIPYQQFLEQVIDEYYLRKDYGK